MMEPEKEVPKSPSSSDDVRGQGPIDTGKYAYKMDFKDAHWDRTDRLKKSNELISKVDPIAEVTSSEVLMGLSRLQDLLRENEELVNAGMDDRTNSFVRRNLMCKNLYAASDKLETATHSDAYAYTVSQLGGKSPDRLMNVSTSLMKSISRFKGVQNAVTTLDMTTSFLKYSTLVDPEAPLEDDEDFEQFLAKKYAEEDFDDVNQLIGNVLHNLKSVDFSGDNPDVNFDESDVRALQALKTTHAVAGKGKQPTEIPKRKQAPANQKKNSQPEKEKPRPRNHSQSKTDSRPGGGPTRPRETTNVRQFQPAAAAAPPHQPQPMGPSAAVDREAQKQKRLKIAQEYMASQAGCSRFFGVFGDVNTPNISPRAPSRSPPSPTQRGSPPSPTQRGSHDFNGSNSLGSTESLAYPTTSTPYPSLPRLDVFALHQQPSTSSQPYTITYDGQGNYTFPPMVWDTNTATTQVVGNDEEGNMPNQGRPNDAPPPPAPMNPVIQNVDVDDIPVGDGLHLPIEARMVSAFQGRRPVDAPSPPASIDPYIQNFENARDGLPLDDGLNLQGLGLGPGAVASPTQAMRDLVDDFPWEDL